METTSSVTTSLGSVLVTQPPIYSHICHEWMSCLNRRQKGTIVALDIKAAFDRVWHKGLLVKLVANRVEGQLLQ